MSKFKFDKEGDSLVKITMKAPRKFFFFFQTPRRKEEGGGEEGY